MVRNATTVSGVTSNWKIEYTPTLMTTSWIMAMMAARAIFHSSRRLRYSNRANRNTTSACSALWLMSLPHEGPTVLTLTWLGWVWPSLARMLRTWSVLAAVALGASTRIESPIVWILVPDPTITPSSLRACSTETPGALTCHDTPPTKSMPRLRPRVASDSTLTKMSTPENTRARFHHFGK